MTTREELLEFLPDNQHHLLRFWEELNETQRETLAGHLQAIDFAQLESLYQKAASDETPWGEMADRATTPPAVTLDDLGDANTRQRAREAGETALRNGEVGFILVAGGQGTRLGFELPKGMYPIGPLSGRTLFQMMTDLVRARSQHYGAPIPVYLMTSPATDRETREHAVEEQQFGLAPDQLQIFCQGTMPAVDDKTGKCLLKSRSELFLSPDGHGGLLKAFTAHGCLDDAEKRGIKYLFYCQVDNPLAQICDPVLIGLHILNQSQLTSQVVRKQDPLQRVGNVVQVDGRTMIIEYSDLPEVNARQTNADGSLKFWAGSIAVHVFDTSFLRRVAEQSKSNDELLPFHIAHKKVPHLDEAGNPVSPESPNAFKFERFVFDLLPLADHSIVVEVNPAEGFAAVKNAPPATTETAQTTQDAIVAQHRRWLESAGVQVADGVKVEIHPQLAHDAETVAQNLKTVGPVTDDKYFAPDDSCN